MVDVTMKFTIVGDPNTGKSSILNTYINNRFDPMISPSVGIDFGIKNIEVDTNYNNIKKKNTVKLFIWDTVGQERYFSITKSYFRGVSGIFLVFSLNNITSFRNLEKWLEEIIFSETDKNIVIFLIGNKSDLKYENNNSLLKNIVTNQWVVTDKEIYNFIERYNLQYYETSVKLDQNIEFIFEDMVKTILDKVENKEIQLDDTRYVSGIKINKKYNNFQIIKTKDSCCN